MRFKKLLSAALAGSMAASAMLVSAAFPTYAADEKLTFDIRSNDSNTVSVTANEIAAGDVTVPFSVYIPENPGVWGINLKLQVNDGQVGEDGLFGNYGMYLTGAQFAKPYCFDSAHSGDSAYSFTPTFNADQMNIIWVYSSENVEQNADACAEAGTTAWSKTVSWAYDYAFVSANLVIPKDTPSGTYTLDIRKEQYLNYKTISKDTPKYGMSACKTAGSDGFLEFESIPLTVIVEGTETTSSDSTGTTTSTTATETTTTESTTTATETTTTESTTTATETTTTTATETTTTESTTSTTETTTSTTITTQSTTTETGTTASTWKDDYKIEDAGHYFIIGDVCGKPGETVKVPVYVYGDPGTAGITSYFDSPTPAKIVALAQTRRPAYPDGETMLNVECEPKSLVYVSMYDTAAADGAVLVQLSVEIPEDAGTVYPIKFHNGNVLTTDGTYSALLVSNRDGQEIPTEYYDGTVTVISDGKTALNYTSYMFTGPDEHLNLTLFNAHDTVTWTSSDPTVATVDSNGFVTSKKLGSATITAACGDETYTCSIMVGLFGDVDQNGAVNAADAQMTLREYVNMLAGKDSFMTEAQRKIADVSGDGNVAADDAQYILKYYVNTLAAKDISWYELTKNPKAPGGPEA